MRPIYQEVHQIGFKWITCPVVQNEHTDVKICYVFAQMPGVLKAIFDVEVS